jgi:hypothetical protein
MDIRGKTARDTLFAWGGASFLAAGPARPSLQALTRTNAHEQGVLLLRSQSTKQARMHNGEFYSQRRLSPEMREPYKDALQEIRRNVTSEIALSLVLY